ncbi:MAG: DUF3352 domain-containing protein [Roseiflexaceae bacterium]
MSDPQQPAPSSYYATTRLPETDMPPPPPPARRGRGWLYAAIGAVLVIAIGAGFFFVLGRTLFQGQREIPKLVGDDAQIYLSLTPNLSAVQGVQRLKSAYPQLFIDQDTSNIDKALDELMGVKFKDDVQPWLGAEMAITVRGLKGIPAGQSDGPLSESSAEDAVKDAKIAIILASSDTAKAQAFLDKQRTNRGGKGQQFAKSEHNGVTIYEQQDAKQSPIAAFAMVQGYVVFASDTTTINAMLDRGSDGKSTLADSARFKGVLDNLPKAAIAYMYLDGPSISNLVDSMMQESLQELPEAQRQQVEDQFVNLKAWQGLGLSVSVDPEGLQFDTAVNFDVSKFSADMKAQIEEAKTPADAERLKNISNKAIALVTFRIPATFKDQVLKAIKAQENGEQSLEEMEQQTGINLEHDVLDWLVGDVSLVVLPGEKLGDVTIPATGYLALKPKDKGAAEAGMKKIGDALQKLGEGQGVAFEEQTIGGVSWQVIKEQQGDQVMGGYGFAGDELVIAFGNNSLEAAGGKDTPVTEDASFKLINGKLANPNAGIFYVNVTSAVELADQIGVGSEDTPEEQEFRKNIKPIKGVGLAAAPGIDDKGVARARLFIYIGEN